MPLHLRRFCALVVVLVVGPVACAPAPRASCTGESVQLRAKGVLAVGTDFAFPPFAFDDPKTLKPTGFEVELAGAIADRLKLKLLLLNRTSTAQIPGLLAHRHDLGASGLVDTPRLRREVCVSAPYLAADLGVAALTGNSQVRGLGDLARRTVGVPRGSRGERETRAHLPDSRVVQFETSEDLWTALRSGKIEAAADELPIVRYADKISGDISFIGVMSTGDDYVLAASPNNAELIRRVNDVLRGMRRDGALQKLRVRWFGE